MINEEYFETLRSALVATATAVVEGKVGIVLGCRRLYSLKHSMQLDDFDEDFQIFLAVDSQTDHLPVDEERRNWGLDALRRKDIEIAEAEGFFRSEVVAACQKLLVRFDK